MPLRSNKPRSTKAKARTILSGIINLYTVIGVMLIILATLLFVAPILPYLWYRLNTDATEQEITTIETPVDQTDTTPQPDPHLDPPAETVTLPPFDPALPTLNTLLIPSIGVDSPVHEGTDATAALENGVWRAPEFGTPEDTATIILAAHRFGYLSWTTDFRTKRSFYNLPKTGVGDRVEIIWNQRKYIYEIYRAEDSTAIVDYDADLVLYTCRMFNSPVRVFRYAQRVE
ncbi:MAG: sortase [Candidatus Dojkabacteria bacterium]|nr:sortase [Candidatus Dojkabacteria bacterium]